MRKEKHVLFLRNFFNLGRIPFLHLNGAESERSPSLSLFHFWCHLATQLDFTV